MCFELANKNIAYNPETVLLHIYYVMIWSQYSFLLLSGPCSIGSCLQDVSDVSQYFAYKTLLLHSHTAKVCSNSWAHVVFNKKSCVLKKDDNKGTMTKQNNCAICILNFLPIYWTLQLNRLAGRPAFKPICYHAWLLQLRVGLLNPFWIEYGMDPILADWISF